MRSEDEVVLRFSAEATTVDEGLTWLVQKMDHHAFSPDSLQFTMYAVNCFLEDEDDGHWETFYQCGIAGTVQSAKKQEAVRVEE